MAVYLLAGPGEDTLACAAGAAFARAPAGRVKRPRPRRAADPLPIRAIGVADAGARTELVGWVAGIPEVETVLADEAGKGVLLGTKRAVALPPARSTSSLY